MKALISLSLLLAFSAQARTLQIKVIDVLEPTEGEKSHIVLAGNGQVYEVPSQDAKLVSSVKVAQKMKTKVAIEIDENSDFNDSIGGRSIIEHVEITSNLKNMTGIKAEESRPFISPMNNYAVTELKSMEEAKKLFETMTPYTRRKSECFNRAYIWSMDLNKNFGVYAGKMWLYFTPKYLWKFRKHKWWFHVAPYFKVAGQKEEIMFDREFDPHPKPYTEWKSDYILNNYKCPHVEKYSDYDQHQDEHDCFIMKSSAYYWEPGDLEALEAEGVERKGFDKEIYGEAYNQAISRWF